MAEGDRQESETAETRGDEPELEKVKPSMRDYKSRVKKELGKSEMEYVEITPEKHRLEQKPNKTPEQITDEDYKVAPTSADKEKIQE